jgi:hypothetical protein
VLVGDQPRLHREVTLEERFHVDDEVLDNRKAAHRLDRDRLPEVFHQNLARETVHAVDEHRVGTADPVSAGTPQRER